MVLLTSPCKGEVDPRSGPGAGPATSSEFADKWDPRPAPSAPRSPLQGEGSGAHTSRCGGRNFIMTIEMTDPRLAVSAAPHQADILVPQHPLSQRLRAWGLWLVLMGLLAWSWSPAEMFRVTALFTDWRNMAEFGHAF